MRKGVGERRRKRCAGLAAVWLLVVWCVWLCGGELSGSVRGGELEREDLATLLERGLGSFREGDYVGALGYLDRARRGYGEDREYRERGLDRLLLPLMGQAAYHVGAWDQVRESFGKYLMKVTEGEERLQALWMLAAALGELGEWQEADQVRERVEEEFPGRMEAHLVHVQRALARLSGEDPREGLLWLREFAHDPERPMHLRVKARLRAIRAALDQGSLGTARVLLLEEPWALDQMPELAALAFVAMEIGDQLLEEGEPEGAVRAYRLVPPQGILLRLQQERLEEMEERLAAWEPVAGAHPLRAYYRGLLERTRAGEARLRESPDYTPGLWLRLSAALSASGRPREAWLLLEELVLGEETPEEARREAHYRWLFVAVEMERWEAARVLAQTFLESHPQSDRAPSALFLLSGILQEVGELSEAAVILSDLIAAYPDHPMRGRWAFNLAHLRLQFGEFSQARRNFAEAAASAPRESPLFHTAGLWRILTYTHEGNHSMAYEKLHGFLHGLPEGIPIRAEGLFRLAMVCRLLGKIEEAFSHLADAEREHPGGSLLAAIHALQGDLLMGEGRLDEALRRFQQIPPDESMFDYVTFQQVAIHRTRGDWEAMLVGLLDYLERVADRVGARRAEALHGIGLALEHMDRVGEVLPLYLEAVQTVGNEPEESQVALLLDGLGSHLERAGESARDWLERAAVDALQREEVLYWSRLIVALIRRADDSGEPSVSSRWFQKLAEREDLEELDPEAIARLGWWWFESGDDRWVDLLQGLIENHPDTPHRAYAFVALGESALAEGKPALARRWFQRMEHELPVHPFSFRAGLGLVRALRLEGEWEIARQQVRELLTLPAGRGRGHAEALWEMVEIEQAAGRTTQAAGYAQRLTALHRGERDLVARAHKVTARYFEESGDLAAALARWERLAEESWPAGSIDPAQAQLERDRLARLQPTTTPEPSLGMQGAPR